MTVKDSAGWVPSSLVFAIEFEARWTAESRFASSVLSAIAGQLPFHRYFGAGRRARTLGVGADAVERAAHEATSLTFHPVDGFLLGLEDPRAVVERMNASNARDLGREWDRQRDRLFAEYVDGGEASPLADRPPFWSISSGGGPDGFRLHACRVSPDGFDDPKICQIASLATIHYAVEYAQRRACGQVRGDRTLSGIACALGVERSAAAEAAWVLERERRIPVDVLAARLGCRKRTLERELQAVGLTAGKLRLAQMVVGATNQLHSGASLTQIAADQEFADLAHMTRVFKSSCGMSPSALRGSRPSLVERAPRRGFGLALPAAR
ncbi:helix-turn-helix domain-containing protein [Pseudoduganella sp. FT26W]|uniref:Helix-turn-helix domain-containing protein n=1 Tax=Duganella aquatilis TaxID=2666082 RepID=A0A844D450_9BURK|nr:helix-turn-helix domain-containing protein [Duganella aquatilis]MRW84575.1 helix-turn-helix domain-containing protein [Duganella aquatilis]